MSEQSFELNDTTCFSLDQGKSWFCISRSGRGRGGQGGTGTEPGLSGDGSGAGGAGGDGSGAGGAGGDGTGGDGSGAGGAGGDGTGGDGSGAGGAGAGRHPGVHGPNPPPFIPIGPILIGIDGGGGPQGDEDLPAPPDHPAPEPLDNAIKRSEKRQKELSDVKLPNVNQEKLSLAEKTRTQIRPVVLPKHVDLAKSIRDSFASIKDISDKQNKLSVEDLIKKLSISPPDAAVFAAKVAGDITIRFPLDALWKISEVSRKRLRNIMEGNLPDTNIVPNTPAESIYDKVVWGKNTTYSPTDIAIEALVALPGEVIGEGVAIGFGKLSEVLKNASPRLAAVLKNSNFASEVSKELIEEGEKISEILANGTNLASEIAPRLSNWTKESIEHIFVGKVSWTGEGKIQGGLHRKQALERFLEHRSDIKPLSREVLQNGVERVVLPANAFNSRASNLMRDAVAKGSPAPFGGKTLFPENWGLQKTVDAINDVVKNGKIISRKGWSETRVGISDGVQIQVNIDRQGKLITAYPTWNQ